MPQLLFSANLLINMFYSKFKKMKKLFVFIPALFIVLFLLNSFVIKEKKAKKKNEGTKSFTRSTVSDKLLKDPFERVPFALLVNIIFKSADGGQTWQDISSGLPEVEPVNFIAGESDLYLQVKNEIYRSKSNLKTPIWEKENIPDLQSSSSASFNSIVFNRTGVMAFNFGGLIYKKIPASETWFQIHANFKKYAMHTIFEKADGTIFIAYDQGLYKSIDQGKNWKQVQKGLVMKIVESEGVLIATSRLGIIRSTDNGENWQKVISEGGMGITVECIKGGFAAISYNEKTESRRIRISLNRGKTWKAIDEGLPPSSDISSIKQIGAYFICGHPNGIFQSSDVGKTWDKVHPGVENKIFRIYVSGNVLYAVAGNAGC